MPLSRRQLLIAAAAAPAVLSMPAWAAAETPQRRWRGVVMGAEAEITLAVEDAGLADELLQQCLAEAHRLELVYSLYRPESELVRLNAAGRLDRPAPELLEVLSASRSLWRASGGAFDPSVQPLWRLYADWFYEPRADPAGPPAEALERVLAKVGFDAVEFAPSAVVLHREGMQLTLNGIAQGHVTDRIADLLREAGLNHVLVAFGELRALGGQPDGAPWRVEIRAPGRRDPLTRLAIDDRAVATSAGAAGPLDRRGSWNHIIDPRSGLSPRLWAAASVVAPRAMLADGLSTALSLLPARTARSLAAAHDDVSAYLCTHDGAMMRVV